MSLRGQLFKKVTIIGVGLIGGSLGLAIKKRHLAREVIGMSQRHATLAAALKIGAIDQGYHDVKKAIENADLVILSTPVSIIIGMLSMIAPHLKRSCVVTDVGSAKMAIVGAARQSLAAPNLFVGSHPLAGSEKTGVQNASADLFEKSLCVITPTQETHRAALERVKRLWTSIGATNKIVSPEQHDKILAHISHLPHVIAYSLMSAMPPDHLGFAAQGFKDTTRIASSSPQMWHDICLGNEKNVIRAIDEFVKQLSIVRKAINTNDSKNLLNYFKAAKAKRDQLGHNG